LEQTGQVVLHCREVQPAGLPSDIAALERLIIRLAILPDAFGHDFSARQHSAGSRAKQLVADGPRGSTVPLDERVNPIQPPECISAEFGRTPEMPILMDRGQKPIHQTWDLPEMRWHMLAYANWFLSETPAELRDVDNSDMIQGPDRVLV
jgi:hypothetical protein